MILKQYKIKTFICFHAFIPVIHVVREISSVLEEVRRGKALLHSSIYSHSKPAMPSDTVHRPRLGNLEKLSALPISYFAFNTTQLTEFRNTR